MCEEISNAGISEVIYIEPYPMIEAMTILKENRVKVREFEGMKAQAFYKVFKDRRSFLYQESLKHMKERGG